MVGLPKMSKYIPPHLRYSAPPAAASTWERAQQNRLAAKAVAPVETPAAEPLSHTDWLKQQQSRYKPKTAEELQAECATMTFEQLRKRAGPPPNICGGDYGGLLMEADGEDGYSFDVSMSLFKQGRGPPPAPMSSSGDEYVIVNALAAMDGVRSAMDGIKSATSVLQGRYASWYASWGKRLATKWYQEHPRTVPAKVAKPVKPTASRTTREEEPKGPCRVVEEVSEKSGW